MYQFLRSGNPAEPPSALRCTSFGCVVSSAPNAPLAQLDRALVSGTKGCRFDSCAGYQNEFIMCDFSETPYRNDESAGWLLSPVHRRLDCVAIHKTPYIIPVHRDWGLDIFSLSVELIIVTLLLLVAWQTRQKASHNSTNRKSRAVISTLSKTAAILFVAAVIAVTCMRLLHGARADSL